MEVSDEQGEKSKGEEKSMRNEGSDNDVERWAGKSGRTLGGDDEEAENKAALPSTEDEIETRTAKAAPMTSADFHSVKSNEE